MVRAAADGSRPAFPAPFCFLIPFSAPGNPELPAIPKAPPIVPVPEPGPRFRVPREDTLGGWLGVALERALLRRQHLSSRHRTSVPCPFFFPFLDPEHSTGLGPSRRRGVSSAQRPGRRPDASSGGPKCFSRVPLGYANETAKRVTGRGRRDHCNGPASWERPLSLRDLPFSSSSPDHCPPFVS